MKRLFTLLAIVAVAGLTFSCGGNATKKNDGVVENVDDGAVKKEAAPEREGYHDYYLGSSLYGDVVRMIERRYNFEEQSGDIVKGELAEVLEYSFNERGDLVDFLWEGRLGRKTKHYKYDDKGNVIELVQSNRVYVFKHDSAGNMVEKAEYDRDGILKRKWLYKYDSAGNMIEEEWFDYRERLERLEDIGDTGKIVYKYDSAGNEIEMTEYDSDGRLSGKTLYKYDSAGNMIEWASYDSDGSLEWKGLYKYDSAGNVREENTYGADGSLEGKRQYEYDSMGNVTELNVVEYGCRDRMLYKYDSMGNVIEKIRYSTPVNGESLEPMEISEYEIVYRE